MPLPRDRVLACRDPECEGLAEPEQDGDLTYHACRLCGYEFNYQHRPAGETCAAGIPVDALTPLARPVSPPLLQIGRRNADPS